jgi:predicted metal-dependent phosphoesterase TrpH
MAMLEKGYIKNKNEAFTNFLSIGLPGYVERDNGLDINTTISLIRDNNGVSVIAHPGILKNRLYFDEVIKNGIDGIEVFHPSHNNCFEQDILHFAKKRNMIITGGSDYHGHGDKYPEIGEFCLDFSYFVKLKEAF